MADIKITALPALAATADILDVLAIVDVSDNGITASGTTKSVLISELPYLANGSNISLLNNDTGFITVSDFSNNGEAATANRDLGNTDAFGLSFITSGVGRINILAGGDVGIGVTPTEKFHVLGNIANGLTDLIVTGTVPTTSVPTNSGFYGNSGANVNTFQHVFGIRDNNINGFCIAVENTTPTVEDKIFQVGRTGGNTEVRVMDAVSDAGGGTIVLSTNSGETVFNDAGNDVNFRIGGDTDANLFKIDAGLNNIGIGTSTPSQKLDVAGNINVSNAYYIATHQFLHSTVDGTASVTRGNVLIGRGTPTGLTSGGSNGQNNIFIGQLAGAASVGSFNNVAIGNGAMDVAVNTREAVAIGAGALGVLVPSTQTSSINTVALGSGAFNALIDGNYNTALGGSSGQNVTGGGGNTFIGALTGADVSGSYNHSIAIGRAAKVTASNQMVVGAQASGAHINEIFFGAGVEQDAISPLDFEMSLTNIAAGNTDVSAGYDWVHNGSRGTGTGAGGEFIWKTAPAGTTGSAQNALVEALRIKETGVLNMANIPTSSAGLSAGDIWNNSGVLSIV